MAQPPEHESSGRIFSLFEANQLLPQLDDRFARIRQAKSVLIETKADIQRAASLALWSGGSEVGSLYIRALEQISSNVEAIHEMGVLVKDIDLGLCDFPYVHDGRIVYLCWKFGEAEIRWWHEVTCGYKDRHPLD